MIFFSHMQTTLSLRDRPCIYYRMRQKCIQTVGCI